MYTNTQILIVGAGPTGLSAAILLKMHGIDVHIIDAQPDCPINKNIAKAITLDSRALEVIDTMGITEAFLDKHIVCREIRWYKNLKNGNSVGFNSLDKFHTDYPFLLHLPQWEMSRILCEKLNELGVTVEKNITFLKMEQSADKVITTIKKDDKEYIVEAQYVLGCDGTKSKVRESIGAKLELITEGFITFHQLDAKITNFNQDKTKRYTYLLEKNTFTILPIMGDYQRLILASSKSKGQTITEETFSEKLKEIGYTQSTIEDPLWFTELSPRSELSDKYQEGRVFILGDAVHPITPLTGQGVNTGIQDAYNLCWKLVMVLNHKASDKLLLSYEKERYLLGKSLAERANDMTVFLYLLFSEKKESHFIVGLVKKLKKKMIRALFNSSAVMKNYIVEQSQLDLCYEDDEIIIHSTIKDVLLKSGLRMPNIKILKNSQTISLYSQISYNNFLLLIYINKKQIPSIPAIQKQLELLLGNYKHLVKCLILLEDSKASSEYIENNPNMQNIAIDKSIAFKKFKKNHSYYILIRPDTHIAMDEYTDDLSLLDNYFKYFI